MAVLTAAMWASNTLAHVGWSVIHGANQFVKISSPPYPFMTALIAPEQRDVPEAGS